MHLPAVPWPGSHVRLVRDRLQADARYRSGSGERAGGGPGRRHESRPARQLADGADHVPVRQERGRGSCDPLDPRAHHPEDPRVERPVRRAAVLGRLEPFAGALARAGVARRALPRGGLALDERREAPVRRQLRRRRARGRAGAAPLRAAPPPARRGGARRGAAGSGRAACAARRAAGRRGAGAARRGARRRAGAPAGGRGAPCRACRGQDRRRAPPRAPRQPSRPDGPVARASARG